MTFNHGVAGSNPAGRTKTYTPVAQLVRASVLYTGGCRFKPYREYKIREITIVFSSELKRLDNFQHKEYLYRKNEMSDSKPMLVDIKKIGDEIKYLNTNDKSILYSRSWTVKPTLENRLSDEIINFIYEDRGVSEEVSQITEVIFSNIIREITNIIIQERIEPNQYFKRKGNYLFSDYGIKINVRWTFYNVGDESQVTDEMKSFAEANISKQEMAITLFSIGLRYNPSSFKETIQHEVMHFFENFKRGYTPYKEREKYDIAYKYLSQNKNVDTEKMDETAEKIFKYKEYIAKIIYISTTHEQGAFANGAYAYLMSHQEDASSKFGTAMQKTKLFAWLKEVEKAINFFNEYDGDLEPIDKELEKYKIDRAELMSIANGAKKNLQRQLGRIVSKAIDDTEKQYPTHRAIIPESDENKSRRLTEKWVRLNRKYFIS